MQRSGPSRASKGRIRPHVLAKSPAAPILIAPPGDEPDPRIDIPTIRFVAPPIRSPRACRIRDDRAILRSADKESQK